MKKNFFTIQKLSRPAIGKVVSYVFRKVKSINVIPELCNGCRGCQLLCSFIVSREFNPSKSLIRVIKDDHQAISIPLVSCMGRCPAANSDGTPLCVATCPTGALIYGNEEEILSKRRELLEKRAKEPLFRIIAPWKYPFPVSPREEENEAPVALTCSETSA